jgi:hypothetical protein
MFFSCAIDLLTWINELSNVRTRALGEKRELHAQTQRQVEDRATPPELGSKHPAGMGF